ncbi:MAG TPA: adenosylhomocysteinase, partial [Candidatus Limnocylindrales bacterium]
NVREVRENVVEYVVNGQRLHVLAEGRLVNLSCAAGHPASVMDMSFANQALAGEYLAKNHGDLAKGVYDVPTEIDVEVAKLKLAALDIVLDPLTPEQVEYLRSWQHGT